MYDNIELRLLAEQKDLYLKIKQKFVDELCLPVIVDSSIVGFGNILDFYMCWITEKRGELCFSARTEFSRLRKNNLFRIAFLPENQDAIFDAIDRIHHSYLKWNANGCPTEEISKKRNERPLTTAQIHWSNVTELIRHKLEHTVKESTEVDADMLEVFKACGQELENLFEKTCDYIEKTSRTKHPIKVLGYREYIQSDQVTLVQIYSKYNVSYGSFRRYVSKGSTYIRNFFKRTLRYDIPEISDLLNRFTSVLDAVDYNLVPLLVYGMDGICKRKKEAILHMLFGESLSEILMQKCFDLINIINEENDIRLRNQKLLDNWSFYESKICYPQSALASNLITVKTFKPDRVCSTEERTLKKLQKFNSLCEIVEHPDIIFYSTSKTDHRPHFLLRTPKKPDVLGIILPTINMAFVYNIKRCNELHRFCQKNGYGYLIIDDRGNSIYDLKKRTLDPSLADKFNDILTRRSIIIWNDIIEIKQIQPVSNADIAAYVLQNKLHFTMQPFCIKRRNGDI